MLVLAPLERIGHLVSPADLASSPASLAAGKVWLLLTSGFVVEGPPLPQILALAVLAVLVIRFRGSRTFWTASLAGHVGSTLVVYAVVGLAWWADPHAVAGVIHSPDYGISCIWSAGLGAIAAGAWAAPEPRSIRTRRILIPAGALTVLTAVTALSTSEIARSEHLIAFLLGALVVRSARHRVRPDRFQELCCYRHKAVEIGRAEIGTGVVDRFDRQLGDRSWGQVGAAPGPLKAAGALDAHSPKPEDLQGKRHTEP